MKIENLATKIKAFMAILAAGTLLWSYITIIDSRYAKAEELLLVAQRLDQKIDADRVMQETERAFQLQERLWILKERYANKPIPISVKEEILRLRLELDKINRRKQ